MFFDVSHLMDDCERYMAIGKFYEQKIERIKTHTLRHTLTHTQNAHRDPAF